MDQISKTSKWPNKNESDSLASQRVYKKTSANSLLTLYLGSRDLISRRGVIEPLKGVIFVDQKFLCSQKIFGQLTLTFRYGREDEEVMGLKFCNEAVISLKQIWPKVNYDEDISPLQQALLDRLGSGAHPFTLEIGMLAPPSVQLIPAKKYNGAPIGTSYDIRVFMSDLNDEKFQKRTTVKLGIRLIHKVPSDLRSIQQTNPTYTSLPKSIRLRLSPKQLKFHHNNNHNKHNNNNSTSKSTTSIDFLDATFPPAYNSTTSVMNIVDTHPLTLSSDLKEMLYDEIVSGRRNSTSHNCTSTIMMDVASTSDNSNTLKGPEGCIDKPFLWTEGRVSLKASLNKSAYEHDEKIYVTIDIKNNSRKIIRKIRVFAVQHVDVCMFSNGKFKNVVADINENHQIKPNETYKHTYEIIPVKGPTKNWIAVEGSYSNNNSTTMTNSASTATITHSSSHHSHSHHHHHHHYQQVEYGSPSTENYFKIASSAHRSPTTADERNVFAIYVSYYVKVKLTLSGMGGEASLKLPFILGYVDSETNDDDDDDDNKKANESRNSSKEQKHICNFSNDDHDGNGSGDGGNGRNNHNTNCCCKNNKNNSNCGNDNGELINKGANNDIIEEELHDEDHDTISLLDEDDEDNEQKRKQSEEKHLQDKKLLQRYKLKRSSYSRSCEDIDTLSRSSVNLIKAKAVIHRQTSENHD